MNTINEALNSEQKRELLTSCGFVTGPNFETATGRLYRTLGTQSNVWESNLFELIDKARALSAHPAAVKEAPPACARCSGRGWVMVGYGESAGADICPVCIESEAPGAAVKEAEPVAWLRADQLQELKRCNSMSIHAESPSIWHPNAPVAPLPSQGLVAVYLTPPTEPTDEMEVAAENAYEASGSPFPDWKAAYRAMLSAAHPAPPTAAVPTDSQSQGEREAHEALVDVMAEILGEPDRDMQQRPERRRKARAAYEASSRRPRIATRQRGEAGMTPIQKQRLERCIEFLRPISQKAAEEASEVHWIGARNADPDQGSSYCRTCADALVDKLNAEHPDHEYLRDGGWGYEADTPEICEKCGIHLSCTLTDHGVEQELYHWSRYRINLKGKHASVHAYFLLNTLECAYMGNVDDTPWLHGYQLDRAKTIQKEVHRLTRRIDGIRSRAAPAQEKP